MSPEYKEIVKYLMIDEDYDQYSRDDIYTVSIKLDKRKLKLLKELHGKICVQDFFKELTDKITEEIIPSSIEADETKKYITLADIKVPVVPDKCCAKCANLCRDMILPSNPPKHICKIHKSKYLTQSELTTYSCEEFKSFQM